MIDRYLFHAGKKLIRLQSVEWLLVSMSVNARPTQFKINFMHWIYFLPKIKFWHYM